jgi:hypothetical protein
MENKLKDGNNNDIVSYHSHNPEDETYRSDVDFNVKGSNAKQSVDDMIQQRLANGDPLTGTEIVIIREKPVKRRIL